MVGSPGRYKAIGTEYSSGHLGALDPPTLWRTLLNLISLLRKTKFDFSSNVCEDGGHLENGSHLEFLKFYVLHIS